LFRPVRCPGTPAAVSDRTEAFKAPPRTVSGQGVAPYDTGELVRHRAGAGIEGCTSPAAGSAALRSPAGSLRATPSDSRSTPITFTGLQQTWGKRVRSSGSQIPQRGYYQTASHGCTRSRHDAAAGCRRLELRSRPPPAGLAARGHRGVRCCSPDSVPRAAGLAEAG